ncbi:GNAT family N-acetyltransferase [Jiangella anatolica]|uniref:GNAT family N-acetyltransferase n=1 Tax=Jiangella anatolica TaxID=2670374 RepID=A0A2W2B3B3_9ACTN|nr:GNAT family protein [Jiangella anatolica]PZF81815.1 GNAT family N-acetyltransferase [Jiangella anatolica]
MTTIAAVPLANPWIELEPLSSAHLDELNAAVSEPDELFRWLSTWQPGPDGGLAGSLDAALAAAARGDAVGWAIRRRADGRVVGSTSYLDIDPGNGRVEVGSTWVGTAWWRTEVNTATKLLVIGHAFETLGLERVALKTDHLNVRSQRAIERLGARREGVLRHHMRRWDGGWRDTVYYSILREEWPGVRTRLEAALADR